MLFDKMKPLLLVFLMTVSLASGRSRPNKGTQPPTTVPPTTLPPPLTTTPQKAVPPTTDSVKTTESTTNKQPDEVVTTGPPLERTDDIFVAPWDKSVEIVVPQKPLGPTDEDIIKVINYFLKFYNIFVDKYTKGKWDIGIGSHIIVIILFVATILILVGFTHIEQNRSFNSDLLRFEDLLKLSEVVSKALQKVY
ncbi:hypothetical protein SK128_008317 [Halocaridina rubra]|uniref:Uncharacterized protein n=1 Tax=Halocaridina rubra TaxID=373956 RepID=A0AAN9AFC9_HALRR